jgi:uncharacterized protein YndB with AHSA1/START domain
MQDLQLVLTRLIPAPPEKVWRAYTDAELLPLWWGPAGYSCRTKQINLAQGGLWRFDMVAPDGRVFVNRHRYTRYLASERIEFLMDADDDSQPAMQVVIILTSEGTGTRVTQTITFPDSSARTAALAFGADALGQQTLAKLQAIVATL